MTKAWERAPGSPLAKIITGDPFIASIGDMRLDEEGVLQMASWIAQHRPECVPKGGFDDVIDLLPHDGFDIDPLTGMKRGVTDNELLAEIAGRKCYDSFAEAGKPRSNGEYLTSMWQGRIPHRSTGYHPHMTFFIANVSRRVSHELIRNYVGHAKDEEGAPSQESTRFTHHPGIYIAHPYYVDAIDDGTPRSQVLGAEFGGESELDLFRNRAQCNYEEYVATIKRKVETYTRKNGKPPVGLDKKRIYESTAGDLLMSCGTSFVWTTNPMALTKFFHERDDDAADMEMSRFARAWKRLCLKRWPNLFPDFHPKLG